MNDGETHTISRATSVSRRTSVKNSTLSRNSTLIKKNTAPTDLRPSDVLIERFVAWKAIVKQLIAYFEGVADIENNTAREYTKLAAVIQVPFRAGNQFLGEGGIQDVYYGIRDKTRSIADHHSNLGRTIDGSIVQHLQKTRAEIKAHIKNVQNDTGKLATSVARERELSTKLISDLAKSIAVFKNNPMTVSTKDDPYILNMHVMKQLQKQVNEENALQKSIIIMQQNSAHFEEGVVRSIQSAWQTFDEWQSRMSTAVQDTWRILGQNMAALAPDNEWISFAGRSDHLLDPDTPLRNPDTIEYPSKEDPSVIPLHTGMLERRKRFTRSYRESYFVLTSSGYLHEFASSDPHTHSTPQFSLFLPMCTLGPPSSAVTSKSHKFHIESKKDAVAAGRGSSIFGRNHHAWTFRARSHDEMMEWWNDVRMLVARYLIASEQVERSGPVQAAVRSAGYASEDEELTDEDEGSSMEEEPEVAPSAAYMHDAVPPSYSGIKPNPNNAAGMEMGPNGYVVRPTYLDSVRRRLND
ncbi:hypothetical protein EXIGLDRAFT_616364 [Exidia glandulosa HHB12029]|uniref:PH domain-containing protein n=1 Tax=Exidia glandulosa HHB12029 TaxID=1314781 RepID=A0A165GPX0_EXIGL|nr:hypothetical protein EXIGLDRAFT_616364 [Exidia glandulosa HHB12029]